MNIKIDWQKTKENPWLNPNKSRKKKKERSHNQAKKFSYIKKKYDKHTQSTNGCSTQVII